MPAHHPALPAKLLRQPGDGVQPAGIHVQAFVHMQIHVQIVLHRQAEKRAQLRFQIRIAVHKSAQNATRALHHIRNRFACNAIGKNIQRRERDKLQCHFALPCLPQRLRNAPGQRHSVGFAPVDVRAHSPRAMAPGFQQSAFHTALNFLGCPARTVRRHPVNRGKQVPIDRADFFNCVSFVDMHMAVDQSTKQNALRRSMHRRNAFDQAIGQRDVKGLAGQRRSFKAAQAGGNGYGS